MADGGQITLAEALQTFTYDARSGQLCWAVAPGRGGRVKAGDEAGCVNGMGYRQVGFKGRLIRVHRLIWLMTTGQWPDGDVDHVNGDPLDNRLENLRECTHGQNMANMRRPSTNKTGLKGVSPSCKPGRWVARIKDGPKQRHIGSYDTPEEAHAAYCAAAAKAFGEFAREASHG